MNTVLKLELHSGKTNFATAPIDLAPLTDQVSIAIERPSKSSDVLWDETTSISVTLVIAVDGQENRYSGGATGGTRLDPFGQEMPYRFTVNLPTGWFGEGKTQLVKRLGETAVTSYKSWLEISWKGGTDLSTNVVVSTSEVPIDQEYWHNSVQYDTSSSASEEGGDLVVTVSYTANGTERALFAGGTSRSNTGAVFTSAATYDGVAMTELWDLEDGSGQKMQSSGYYKVAPATSAKDVVVTLTPGGTIYEQFVGVVSFTGVEQSGAAVGTAVTDTGASTPATVTVGSVGTDDMCVDCVIANGSTLTVGADQNSRQTFNSTFASRSGISTQPGASGGVMSWTVANQWVMGAVAFKASAGGSVFTPYFYQQHIAAMR